MMMMTRMRRRDESPEGRQIIVSFAQNLIHIPRSKLPFTSNSTVRQAYPVMGVIVFAVAFSTVTGLWFMTCSPDSRISKYSRKHIFRGDTLRAEEH